MTCLFRKKDGNIDVTIRPRAAGGHGTKDVAGQHVLMLREASGYVGLDFCKCTRGHNVILRQIISCRLSPHRTDVIHHVQRGTPAEFVAGFAGIVFGFGTAGVSVDHFYFPSEGFRDFQDGIALGSAEGVAVAASSFAGEDDAAGEVFHVGESAALRAGAHDGEGFAKAVAALETCDERGVFTVGGLSRAKRVVKIADRVGEIIPAAVVIDKIDVDRLRERIGVLVAAVAFDRESRARGGVDQFLDLAVPAEFDDRKRADDVHVVDQGDVAEGRRDASVLAEVVDDVRGFGDEGVDVFRVAAAILRAGDMVGHAPGEVVVEGNDAGSGVLGREKELDHVGPDVACAAGDEDGLLTGHLKILTRCGGRELKIEECDHLEFVRFPYVPVRPFPLQPKFYWIVKWHRITMGAPILRAGGLVRFKCLYSLLLLGAVPFSGFSQSASTTFYLVDKSAISTKTDGASGSVGYARILLNSGQTTPSGVAIYGYTPANVLVGEAGVPASPLIKNGRIYAEVGPNGLAGPGTDIGLAIANPGTTAAAISYTFTNTSGVDVGGGTFTLAAGAQSASYLDQSNWNVPLNFQGAFSFSSNTPVSVVALQQYINARGDGLFTTLPVLDLDSGATSTTPAVLSQFADGAGWTTEVLLVNPTDNPISGTIQFLVGTTGAPLSLTANGTAGSSFSYMIASHSSFKLLTAGATPGSTPVTGSVVVTPSSGSVTPFSLAVFSFATTTTITQAGVPSNPGTSFRTYVEASTSFGNIGSYSTGYAVANASSTPGTITLTLYNPDGSATPYSATVPIAANGQFAEFLYQRFPALPLPFQGILRISTTTPQISVVALRIRVNQRGEYLQTSIPATEENGTPPNTEYDFPQIADGLGFTTQFVLFSGYRGQATNGTLSFVRPSGQPLSLNLASTITGPVTLTSIVPTAAAVGTTITLTGTGFTSSSIVNFTSASGTTPVVASSETSTSLIAVVPSNAVTGPVFVSNGSQSSAPIVVQVMSANGNATATTVTVSAGTTTSGTDIFVPPPAGSLSIYAVGTATSGAAYPQPVTLTRGTSTQVFIAGSDFSSSTIVSASGSGDVTTNGLTVFNSTQLEFTINVSASAATGPRTLFVTNPNGDISSLTGGMIIQ